MALPLILGALLVGIPVDPSVVADLNSPTYAIREKARDALRANYESDVNGARKASELLHALQMKEDQTDVSVAEICQHHGCKLEPLEVRDITTYIFCIPIDDNWSLLCTFKDGILIQTSDEPPIITNPPPPHYTGLWRTYLISGKKLSEYYYVDGKSFGPLTDGGDRVIHTTLSGTTVIENYSKTYAPKDAKGH